MGAEWFEGSAAKLPEKHAPIKRALSLVGGMHCAGFIQWN
jgi:hypothetical protein